MVDKELDGKVADYRINRLDLENSPFCHRTPHLKWYEWAKTILVCLTGLPLIRMILTILLLLMMTGNYMVFTCCLCIRERPGFLRFITTWTGYFGCRCLLFVWGFYFIPRSFRPGSHRFGLSGWIPCSGCCMKTSPPLLIANHSSALTDFVILLTFHLPAFVAMAPVRNYPVIGRLAEGIGCLFVDREKKKGGSGQGEAAGDKKRKPGVAQLIKDRVNGYSPGYATPRLAIFPEGTVTQAHSLTRFRTGAFLAGAPVQPLCIHYSGCGTDLSTLNLAGGPSDAVIFLRMLTSISNYVSLEYLPVYEPSTAEKRDPKLYANNVRRVMAAALGYPTSEHTYEDLFLQGNTGGGCYYEDFILHKISGLQIKALTGLRLKDMARLSRGFRLLDELEQTFVPVTSPVAAVADPPIMSLQQHAPPTAESANATTKASSPRGGRSAGRGVIGRTSFHALVLGVTKREGSIVEQVWQLLLETEPLQSSSSPDEGDGRGGGGGGGGSSEQVIGFLSAVIGIGILNKTLPAQNKVRLALCPSPRSAGLVKLKDARELLEMGHPAAAGGEEKEENKGRGGGGKKKKHQDVILELYDSDDDEAKIHINTITSSLSQYPVLQTAADVWLRKRVPLLSPPNMGGNVNDIKDTSPPAGAGGGEGGTNGATTSKLPDIKRLRHLLVAARLSAAEVAGHPSNVGSGDVLLNDKV